MSFLIQYDALNGIIEGVFSGEVEGNLLRQYSIEAEKICHEHHCSSILTDYTNASFSFSVVEIYRLPQKHNELLKSVGLNVHSLKRAALFDKDYLEMACFFEDVAVNQGQKFRVFTERSKALEWLLSNK